MDKPLADKRIVVVDDDADMRAAIRVVLAAAGCAVEEASNGEDGLLLAQKSRPDAVLADLMMEEINSGCDLARALRDGGYTGVILLLSTAGEPVSRNIEPGAYGLDGILQKPVPPAALLDALRARLG